MEDCGLVRLHNYQRVGLYSHGYFYLYILLRVLEPINEQAWVNREKKYKFKTEREKLKKNEKERCTNGRVKS